MTSTSKDTSKEIDWRVVALAETHPLRVLILEEMRKSAEPLSPWKLAQLLDEEKCNSVAYHVRALAKAGVLVLSHEVARRGAQEHFYRLSAEVVR